MNLTDSLVLILETGKMGSAFLKGAVERKERSFCGNCCGSGSKSKVLGDGFYCHVL